MKSPFDVVRSESLSHHANKHAHTMLRLWKRLCYYRFYSLRFSFLWLLAVVSDLHMLNATSSTRLDHPTGNTLSAPSPNAFLAPVRSCDSIKIRAREQNGTQTGCQSMHRACKEVNRDCNRSHPPIIILCVSLKYMFPKGNRKRKLTTGQRRLKRRHVNAQWPNRGVRPLFRSKHARAGAC